MKEYIKIATILPYKENYTFSKAQAAAIWVCDFYKHTEFKNSNFIFGNTAGKDYLTKNYININISNLKSKLSILSSITRITLARIAASKITSNILPFFVSAS